ncbi:hypothetical protein ACFTY7_15025 [Streptomyces sp. NPDC057062]|uniref:hypothetical protein n=1 Tax=Streptomyces sp. NPDC057062 TaxID=3346011 RepID=UPI00362CEE30
MCPQVLDALRALADKRAQICWEVSIDFTITRAHQHAADTRREAAGRRNQGRAGITRLYPVLSRTTGG